MAGHSSVMLGWSWTALSGLGSQLFGIASAGAVRAPPIEEHERELPGRRL